jgi:hypothetical protein
MIPPLRRLPEAPELVGQLGYFVVHAPRQTGKTTTLAALANELTATGELISVLSQLQDGYYERPGGSRCWASGWLPR